MHLQLPARTGKATPASSQAALFLFCAPALSPRLQVPELVLWLGPVQLASYRPDRNPGRVGRRVDGGRVRVSRSPGADRGPGGGGQEPPRTSGVGLRPSLKGSTALGPELSWTTGSRQGTAGEKLGSRARGEGQGSHRSLREEAEVARAPGGGWGSLAASSAAEAATSALSAVTIG